MRGQKLQNRSQNRSYNHSGASYASHRSGDTASSNSSDFQPKINSRDWQPKINSRDWQHGDPRDQELKFNSRMNMEIESSLNYRRLDPSLPAYTLVPRGERSCDEDYAYVPVALADTCYTRWRKGRYVIVPDENVLLDIWDCLVIAALFTTALVVPFEVALYEHSPQILIVLGDYMNYVFAFDIVITFNVARHTTNPLSKDAFDKDPVSIARYYMACPLSDKLKAGWFWPDLVTVVPWENVHIMMIGGAQAVDGDSVRLVRILRLVRMFRLVRVIKLVKRWHTSFGVSFATVEICKCFALTMIITHWLACGWCSLAINFEKNWLSGHAASLGKEVSELSRFAIYNMALYFCTMILTTVGLGDLLPATQLEMLLATLTMFFTSILWAWVLAIIVNVITNSDAFTTRFNQLSDDLNKLVDARNCSHKLKSRMRKFLNEAEHVYRFQSQRDSLEWLSSGLQGDIAIESGIGDVCDTIWYLRHLHGHVLVELARQFHVEMYCPDEFLNDLFSLSVLMKGSCFHKGYIIVPTKVISEDMILSSDLLREMIFPKTLTFVEVMTLKKDHLMAICDRHPDFSHRIRRAQIKLALWRGFIAEARARKTRKTQVSAWERTTSKVGRRTRSADFQALEPLPSSRPSPSPRSRPPVSSDSFEMRAFIQRIDDGFGDLRMRFDRLEARIQQVEERTSRSRHCRTM